MATMLFSAMGLLMVDVVEEATVEEEELEQEAHMVEELVSSQVEMAICVAVLGIKKLFALMIQRRQTGCHYGTPIRGPSKGMSKPRK